MVWGGIGRSPPHSSIRTDGSGGAMVGGNVIAVQIWQMSDLACRSSA